MGEAFHHSLFANCVHEKILDFSHRYARSTFLNPQFHHDLFNLLRRHLILGSNSFQQILHLLDSNKPILILISGLEYQFHNTRGNLLFETNVNKFPFYRNNQDDSSNIPAVLTNRKGYDKQRETLSSWCQSDQEGGNHGLCNNHTSNEHHHTSSITKCQHVNRSIGDTYFLSVPQFLCYCNCSQHIHSLGLSVVFHNGTQFRLSRGLIDRCQGPMHRLTRNTCSWPKESMDEYWTNQHDWWFEERGKIDAAAVVVVVVVVDYQCIQLRLHTLGCLLLLWRRWVDSGLS